ncbi:MAG: carotenoid biosynthesis protein [Ignavibacteria bacterium]
MSDKFKTAIIYIIFVVGIVGHLSDHYKNGMISITPYVLIMMGIYVLLISNVRSDNNFILWFFFSYISTLLLEIIGVKTGLIFGEYIYGNTLGFKVAEVPLIIGFNWLFVILGGIGIGKKISDNMIIVSLIAGITAVIFDLVLEPVAIDLHYWNWVSGEIPLQNYLAWFIITFVISLFYCSLKTNIRNNYFIHYLIAQFVFFLLLCRV